MQVLNLNRESGLKPGWVPGQDSLPKARGAHEIQGRLKKILNENYLDH